MKRSLNVLSRLYILQALLSTPDGTFRHRKQKMVKYITILKLKNKLSNYSLKEHIMNLKLHYI